MELQIQPQLPIVRYFEFEILTAGFMKIGWMDVAASPDIQLGQDDRSYAFDGYLLHPFLLWPMRMPVLPNDSRYLGRKWHQGAESYGKEWKVEWFDFRVVPPKIYERFQIGDVVGCFLDLNDRTISFSLNGELLLVSEWRCEGDTCGTLAPLSHEWIDREPFRATPTKSRKRH